MKKPLVSALAAMAMLAACSGGSSDSGGSGNGPPAPPPPPPSGQQDTTFQTESSTARFLSQATFGPSSAEIAALTGTSASQWLLAEFNRTPSLNLPFVREFALRPEHVEDFGINYFGSQAPSHSFWINAISGEDQLRQRMAYALSQIFVISNSFTSSNILFGQPLSVAHYQDVLVENAFGNFRDLLEDVTYSPAMGVYLTYFQNQKGDPNTGRMPDENYAREVMQLFSIGLVELNPDGTPVTDGSGNPVETYDTDDVTGLAKVFTGLSLDLPNFWQRPPSFGDASLYSPMVMFEQYHSTEQKQFLGTTIAADTPGDESISIALDTLFEHPNVAPFFARQLIQRFVTSDPDPAYVGRVAAAFERGTYTLPDGVVVGDTGRGDLKATLAAVLMDEQARSEAARDGSQFGKIREPVLRFTHWARAFGIEDTLTPWHTQGLWDTSASTALSQGAYKSPSVFNFYRPGYVAPGTASGNAGMTVPELQITNASTVVGYTNFMSFFVFRLASYNSGDESTSFIADYDAEFALASDPAALVDHLDMILTHGALTAQQRQGIVDAITPLRVEDDPSNPRDGPILRVGTAILLIMTSPDYVVQR